METTEKIVEAYCRYVRDLFTIPNVKCKGQYEIDLLAIDPKRLHEKGRYHIEVGVSIASSFSKLTSAKFSIEKLRQRSHQASQRRTIGYYIERKFGAPEVIEELNEYGFSGDNYNKVIVTWGWDSEAEVEARENNIQLWDFRNILDKIAKILKLQKAYFVDDTLRTIQLFVQKDKK